MPSAAAIVDVSPFATDPPHLGGQVAIRSTNAAIARLGCPVEQFSLGLRPSDLRYVGRTRRLSVSPGYVELRRTEPLSVLMFLLSAAAHLPYWWASRALVWRPWPELHLSLRAARAVMVEMPWCFAPSVYVRPSHVPLIYASHNAEFLLARSMPDTWPGLKHFLVNWVERMESQILAHADMTFAITADDAHILAEHYGVDASSIHVVPRGLDLERYAWLSPQQRQQLRGQLGLHNQFVIVFAASRHPPNLAAARLAVELAQALGDGFTVVIAGSVAKAFDARSAFPARAVSGDPEAYLKVADLAINPMLSGSGMNIKMLQYLAWGLPVVTTTVGARGLDGQAGLNYVIAEPAVMLDCIKQLAANQDRLIQLRQAGRALVAERYSVDVTARRMLDLIEDWRPPAVRSPAH